MFNFDSSSIRLIISIIFFTIKNHPFLINCPLIVQYLSPKRQTYVLFTKNLVRFDKIIQHFSKNNNFISDCKNGDICATKSVIISLRCKMYKFDSIIKKLRTDSKMTQKELALAIGVSQQTVSLWESRSAVPDALAIIDICKLFNVSSDYLPGIETANKRHFIKKIKTDCEFGGPRFNTSELNQVRSILDFLREQQKRK